jgi:hypothetical protein
MMMRRLEMIARRRTRMEKMIEDDMPWMVAWLPLLFPLSPQLLGLPLLQFRVISTRPHLLLKVRFPLFPLFGHHLLDYGLYPMI